MKPKNLVIVRAVREQGLSMLRPPRDSVSPANGSMSLSAGTTPGDPTHWNPAPEPRRHVPARPHRQCASDIQLRGDLTKQGADAGPLTIAWHLQTDGYQAPSTATIRRILHAEGLITPAPNNRPSSSYIRFQADLPNECWQADITHWYLACGTRVEILDFLDDHSRLLLDIRPAAAFTGPMVVTAMTELISRYGPPHSTLTDNGLVFTTRLARFKGARGGFEKLLAAHGITRKNGRPADHNLRGNNS